MHKHLQATIKSTTFQVSDNWPKFNATMSQISGVAHTVASLATKYVTNVA